MTDLWLVRHGEAVPERADPTRPLSEEGIRSIAAVASALAGRMGRIGLVASSEKRRARQTAEILAAAAGYPAEAIVETKALSPDAPPEAFLSFLAEHRDKENVLCVGHLPSIAAFASCLLPPSESRNWAFPPGGVCSIRLSGIRRGGGELLLFQQDKSGKG